MVEGLGWLPVATRFEPDKVLDRPSASVVAARERADGRRLPDPPRPGHRARAGAERWLVTDDGTAIGWRSDDVLATTLHGLFEDDELRAAILVVGGRPARGSSPADWARCRSPAPARPASI